MWKTKPEEKKDSGKKDLPDNLLEEGEDSIIITPQANSEGYTDPKGA
jgi:hypothetical protein